MHSLSDVSLHNIKSFDDLFAFEHGIFGQEYMKNDQNNGMSNEHLTHSHLHSEQQHILLATSSPHTPSTNFEDAIKEKRDEMIKKSVEANFYIFESEFFLTQLCSVQIIDILDFCPLEEEEARQQNNDEDEIGISERENDEIQLAIQQSLMM